MLNMIIDVCVYSTQNTNSSFFRVRDFGTMPHLFLSTIYVFIFLCIYINHCSQQTLIKRKVNLGVFPLS